MSDELEPYHVNECNELISQHNDLFFTLTGYNKLKPTQNEQYFNSISWKTKSERVVISCFAELN